MNHFLISQEEFLDKKIEQEKYYHYFLSISFYWYKIILERCNKRDFIFQIRQANANTI